MYFSMRNTVGKDYLVFLINLLCRHFCVLAHFADRTSRSHTTIIAAHEATLAVIAVNYDGTRLATASEKVLSLVQERYTLD